MAATKKTGKATAMPPAKKVTKKLAPAKEGSARLLSGGNPQIAKGHGDAPVQAWIAAAPDWKGDLTARLDAIITRTVPNVRKAVKWNSSLYGMEENRWFLGLQCMTKYVKVAFFKGAHLTPLPPNTSKQQEVRYLDLYEGQLDEKRFAAWVKQASRIPGEKM